MASQTSSQQIYIAKLQAFDWDYDLDVNLTKVEKSELLFVFENFQFLKGVKLNDNDNKASLLIHIVLGNGEYARIKTNERSLVGNEWDPIAEKTK